MLGGLGRGRGRAKLLENGPPAPLRRPRERTSVTAGGGGGGGEGDPAPPPPEERQQLRRPTAPPAAAAVPVHNTQDTGPWSGVSVPGLSGPVPGHSGPGPVPGHSGPVPGLNPHSAPFVPAAPPARPVSGALVTPEDSDWGSEVDSEEPEPAVNQALVTDIPEPQDAFQSMVYNNLAETLWNMACVPASFDRQGMVLVENLNGWLPSSGIRLTTVLDFMMNQVAYVPAFRYVCAKLCHLMCSRCRVTEEGRTFRDLLLGRCQALYLGAGELLTENVAFFSDLTVLFCELYLHVRLSAAEEPIAVLGTAVLGLCGQLMDDVTPERVTAVCQALKLAGAALERQVAPELDALMERVRSAAFDGRLPRDERHALLELTTLRAAHWGGAEGGGLPAPASQQTAGLTLQGYCPVEPPAGLSNEERSFLEQQLHAADDEDEDEVDEAYDAFLEELDRQH